MSDKDAQATMVVECRDAWDVVFGWQDPPKGFNKAIATMRDAGVPTAAVVYAINRCASQPRFKIGTRARANTRLEYIKSIVWVQHQRLQYHYGLGDGWTKSFEYRVVYRPKASPGAPWIAQSGTGGHYPNEGVLPHLIDYCRYMTRETQWVYQIQQRTVQNRYGDWELLDV